MKKILRILHRLRLLTPNLYRRMLQLHGVAIGANTRINPNSVVDITRPSLVTIGENCYLNSGLVLLTHDFVSGVIRNVYADYFNSSGKVTIGNNVRTGYNVTILKGVTIGDNCFIAANSVVTRSMPSNSIIGGSPARVLSTLDDYYNKRKDQCVAEALEYARSIEERFHRKPVVSDFWEEFHLFIDKDNVEDFDEEIMIYQLGGKDNYCKWLSHHTKTFSSFQDFINHI